MLTPTVGRIVHYWPEPDVERPLLGGVTQPLAAIITHVHGPSSINVCAFTADGDPRARSNVHLVPSDVKIIEPPKGCYCTWPVVVPAQVTTGPATTGEVTEHDAAIAAHDAANPPPPPGMPTPHIGEPGSTSNPLPATPAMKAALDAEQAEPGKAANEAGTEPV